MASSSKPFESSSGFSLLRHLTKEYPEAKGGEGNFIQGEKDKKVLDACGGAAVTCLGHNNKRMNDAMANYFLQNNLTYTSTAFWRDPTVEELCDKIIQGTNYQMFKVYLAGSGSEVVEAAIKLSRQYYYDQDHNTTRKYFIARERSYHGNTLGTLSLSDYKARKDPYEPLLIQNVERVSACYPYRQQEKDQSDEEFISIKVAELEAKFQKLGPGNVIAFIAEPVVGAALGCVASPTGYLKAMRDVCHKHGALFILDEVMCGIGRTGVLHAWQAENVVPDIQLVGKALGAGYQPVSAMIVSKRVHDVLLDTSKEFVHGYTHQGMPIQAVAALEVLRIIEEERLLDNVCKQGALLEYELKDKLSGHAHVGDIRGRGLFWGLEFVKDKKTKETFDPKLKVAYELKELSLCEFDMAIYPSMGCKDNISGDTVIISPAYTVTSEDIKLIVEKLRDVVNTFFSRLYENGVLN
jgi:adenosylmethionine-8-amino-7-oxononanoate aminotransferase